MDFEAIKKFLGKYNKETKKADVNSVIRRMDLDGDGRVTFKEYSISITPEYPGLNHEKMEFNMSQKEQIIKYNEE